MPEWHAAQIAPSDNRTQSDRPTDVTLVDARSSTTFGRPDGARRERAVRATAYPKVGATARCPAGRHIGHLHRICRRSGRATHADLSVTRGLRRRSAVRLRSPSRAWARPSLDSSGWRHRDRSTHRPWSPTGASTSALFGDITSGAYLGHAVYGYFLNGGGTCYVVRVGADDNGDGGVDRSPARARIGDLEVRALEPGTGGQRARRSRCRTRRRARPRARCASSSCATTSARSTRPSRCPGAATSSTR